MPSSWRGCGSLPSATGRFSNAWLSRYPTLAEALAIVEAVTGIDVAVFARASRAWLLHSALYAPQAGFGDEEFYARTAKNHPLADGNARLRAAG